MGLGSLMASLGGAVAGAIGNAVSNSSKNQSSSSNKNTSSSSGSSNSSNSGSGSSGYQPIGSWNDSMMSAADKAQIQQYKQQYNDAAARGDTAAMNAAHQAAESLRQQNYGYIGGTDGSQYITFGGVPQANQEDGRDTSGAGGSLGQQMGSIYQNTFDKYYGDEASAAREEAIKAAQEAAVEKNVLELEAQKGKVQQAGEEGNAAAQQAYMTAINPNGSLAESLAARGLLSSGLTESSQIAAGNAYQDALNSNKMTVTEQLAEIERAISQARLSGDLATAEQLQAWYDTVANAAMQNASNIVSANQWANEFDFNKATTEAGLTGYYNGTATLAQKQFENDTKLLERQLQAGQITQEQFNKQWQAEYETLLAQLQSLELQNKYYQTQL